MYMKVLNLRVLCLILTSGIRYYCKTSYRKYLSLDFFFFKDFIYLTQRQREREHKQGEWEWEEQGARCGAPIPGPWDHDLSQRQTLND